MRESIYIRIPISNNPKEFWKRKILSRDIYEIFSSGCISRDLSLQSDSENLIAKN